jgi:hypothetical protein
MFTKALIKKIMFTKAVLGWDFRYSILNELSLGLHLHNSEHERKKDDPDNSLQHSIMILGTL